MRKLRVSITSEAVKLLPDFTLSEIPKNDYENISLLFHPLITLKYLTIFLFVFVQKAIRQINAHKIGCLVLLLAAFAFITMQVHETKVLHLILLNLKADQVSR